MRPVRRANSDYRVREHLTETEIDNLLAALKRNRHGARDWLYRADDLSPRPSRKRGL